MRIIDFYVHSATPLGTYLQRIFLKRSSNPWMLLSHQVNPAKQNQASQKERNSTNKKPDQQTNNQAKQTSQINKKNKTNYQQKTAKQTQKRLCLQDCWPLISLRWPQRPPPACYSSPPSSSTKQKNSWSYGRSIFLWRKERECRVSTCFCRNTLNLWCLKVTPE